MIKVLLADDQQLFRKGLSMILKGANTDIDVVGEASCIKELLTEVEQIVPDVVIIDTACEWDSIAAIQEIHTRFPKIGIMVLSLSSEENDLFSAIKAGAQAYLLKTSTPNELVSSIQTIANGDSALSPKLISKLVKEFASNKSTMGQSLYNLTTREKQILQYVAHGDSNKEIADKCCISMATVKAHMRNILGKMGSKNRTGAATYAIHNNIISPNNIKETIPC